MIIPNQKKQKLTFKQKAIIVFAAPLSLILVVIFGMKGFDNHISPDMTNSDIKKWTTSISPIEKGRVSISEKIILSPSSTPRHGIIRDLILNLDGQVYTYSDCQAFIISDSTETQIPCAEKPSDRPYIKSMKVGDEKIEIPENSQLVIKYIITQASPSEVFDVTMLSLTRLKIEEASIVFSVQDTALVGFKVNANLIRYSTLVADPKFISLDVIEELPLQTADVVGSFFSFPGLQKSYDIMVRLTFT